MSAIVNVEVSVVAGGKAVCNPDIAVVNEPGTLLSFQLVTPGWAFPSEEAIVVRDPGNNFPYPSWTVQPQLATLLDADTDSGDYAYGVVVQSESGQRIFVDPTIRNGV